MKNKPLIAMSRVELKEHIYRLQEFIENEQKAGKDVDTILDESDISEDSRIINFSNFLALGVEYEKKSE